MRMWNEEARRSFNRGFRAGVASASIVAIGLMTLATVLWRVFGDG